MSRKRKQPELRPVDEAAEKEMARRYFRLDPGQAAADEQQVVKLDAPREPEQKLAIPTRDEVDIRSIEPDIDTLIDATMPAAEGLESDWGKEAAERRPIPWGWFVLIGLVVGGGAFWSITHIHQADDQLKVIRHETQTMLETEEESVATARTLIEDIKASVIAYCEARDIDSLIRVVRHPERVSPLMTDHYARHAFEPLGHPNIETLRPLTLGSFGDFWMATVGLGDGQSKNLIVQAEEGGEALVDWETAVCYQPMAWDDYVRDRPAGSTMDFRVYLEADPLFSHEFQDSSVWDCYKLTALDSEEMLFGYIRSDTPSAQLIRMWFQRHPTQRATMILRLSLPEGLKSPSGVVIEHPLSVRWIYIAPPHGGS